MKTRTLFFSVLLATAITAAVPAQGKRLLRHPTVSRELVAVAYAGELWVVSRGGGQARRGSAARGAVIDPYLSPDGTLIASSATVAGNRDVYGVPPRGGDRKGLTYH